MLTEQQRRDYQAASNRVIEGSEASLNGRTYFPFTPPPPLQRLVPTLPDGPGQQAGGVEESQLIDMDTEQELLGDNEEDEARMNNTGSTARLARPTLFDLLRGAGMK